MRIGHFIGFFLGTLILPVVWLIICKVIPPLRRRPGVSYGIAIALAFLPSLGFIARSFPSQLVASELLVGLLCAALLFWQYTRAKAKLRRAPSNSETPSA